MISCRISGLLHICQIGIRINESRCGHLRQLSSSVISSIAKQRRNELFEKEAKRQIEKIGRIEKITVSYVGVPKDEVFIMNSGISTPYNVAQHISEFICNRSALALVDDSTLWDMHRPLIKDCTMHFLHFHDAEPHHLNKAFWRTCSFLLGAVAENCFKDGIISILHSFPSPNVKSGSFVYDVQLSLDNWQPTADELRILSAEMVMLARKNLKIERLEVNVELAEDMFKDNMFKSKQIPDIAMNNPGNKVVLYRIGDHIDISRGPMLANSNFLGRTSVTAVHKLDSDIQNLYRFQGVSLPKDINLNHFAYSLLQERAKKMNNARYPGQIDVSLGFQDVRSG